MISQPPKNSIGGRVKAPEGVFQAVSRPKRGLPTARSLVFLPLPLIIASWAFSSAISSRDLDRAGLWWPAITHDRRGEILGGGTPGNRTENTGLVAASTLLWLDEPALSAGAFSKWLASSPLSYLRPAGVLGGGVSALGRGDSGRALEILRAGTRGFPVCAQSDELLFWEGEAASRQEDYPAAASSFESLLGRYPGSNLKPRALYGLGWAEGRMKKYESAASRFEEAGRLDGALLAPATLQRGWCVLEMGRTEDARSHFSFVQSGWPGTRYSQEAVIGEAECAYRAGDYARAEKLYDTAFNRAAGPPERSVLRYSLAWAMLKQKSFERARSIFLETARDYPDEPVAPFASYRAALCLLDLGKPAEALAELRSAEGRNPKHEVAEWSAYSRGWIFLAQGRYNDQGGVPFPDGHISGRPAGRPRRLPFCRRNVSGAPFH